MVKMAAKGASVKLVAAELGFSDWEQNLCFQFLSPQEVALTGSSMEFGIGALTGDMWTIVDCPPGGLLQWRWQ